MSINPVILSFKFNFFSFLSIIIILYHFIIIINLILLCFINQSFLFIGKCFSKQDLNWCLTQGFFLSNTTTTTIALSITAALSKP